MKRMIVASVLSLGGLALGASMLLTGNIVFAQSTPQQAQCQQEAAQLRAQLAQCKTDACRQQLQAAIAAHNARCR